MQSGIGIVRLLCTVGNTIKEAAANLLIKIPTCFPGDTALVSESARAANDRFLYSKRRTLGKENATKSKKHFQSSSSSSKLLF
jgi:hypothetical protein